MIEALYVAIGAAVGAPMRLLLDLLLPRSGVPWGVLAANVIGSFTLGLVAGGQGAGYLAVGVGFSGALTTMSALAVDTAVLARGRLRIAVLNVLLSLAAGCAAAVVGLALGSSI